MFTEVIVKINQGVRFFGPPCIPQVMYTLWGSSSQYSTYPHQIWWEVERWSAYPVVRMSLTLNGTYSAQHSGFKSGKLYYVIWRVACFAATLYWSQHH